MAHTHHDLDSSEYSYFFYRKRIYRATQLSSKTRTCEVLRSDRDWMWQYRFPQFDQLVPINTSEQLTRFLETCDTEYAGLVVAELI